MNTQTQQTRPLASFLLAVTGGSVYVVHADSEEQVYRVMSGVPLRCKRNARITRRLTRGEARCYGPDQHISLPIDTRRLIAAVQH